METIQILNPLTGWGFIAFFIALFNIDFSSEVKRFTSFRILFLPTSLLHSGLTANIYSVITVETGHFCHIHSKKTCKSALHLFHLEQQLNVNSTVRWLYFNFPILQFPSALIVLTLISLDYDFPTTMISLGWVDDCKHFIMLL